jgi:hypothetical protein
LGDLPDEWEINTILAHSGIGERPIPLFRLYNHVRRTNMTDETPQEVASSVHEWIDKALTLARVSLEVNGSLPTCAFVHWDDPAESIPDADESDHISVALTGAIPNMPKGAIVNLDVETAKRKEASFRALRIFLARHKALAVMMLTEGIMMHDSGENEYIVDESNELVACAKIKNIPCVAVQIEVEGRYFLGNILVVKKFQLSDKVTFGEVTMDEAGLDELPVGMTTRLLACNEKSKIVHATNISPLEAAGLGAQIINSRMKMP